MKLHEYSRSKSFLDLGPKSFRYATVPFVTKFHKKAFRNKEMKINKYEFGHMTNMAAMLVYGKIIYKKKGKRKVQ